MAQSSPRILIIEDEPAIRIGLEENLKFEGYEVHCSENGQEGLEAYRANKPDLVILDVMMPGIDGFEVCRQIRSQCNVTPIIMLTAKGTEIDKVVGLEIGADDYLTKPFGMRELFARIKAALRRKQLSNDTAKDSNSNNEQQTSLLLEFSDVRVDFQRFKASKAGIELDFSAKEFELLKFLSARPDVPVTRDQLLDSVWGYNSYPTTRTVDNFIARIRQKIEDTPEKPKYILTVHGVGYKFTA